MLILVGRNGHINNPTTIELLFEVCHSLHDGIDFANVKDDDYQQPARLISHFVLMVLNFNYIYPILKN